MDAQLSLTVDGTVHSLTVDTRTTLLDALRERLGVISPKKGCDHGQCGSCTVLLDGRRHLTCLALAVAYDGAEIVTADGLAADGLHPVQQAFLDQDGYQCGYCTPGQVCSAVGMLDELKEGHPSHVTEDLVGEIEPSEVEVRERMSGNLCRCGAYPGILAAVCEAARG
ncbi:2Fe-2S iron-sulfur cluster-binding protein [Nocardioides sp. URHA0020]|uniref:2Fe-2S iron-sulfur cluster-binding protein n=1 Tax=Nocardioides sp. URHA0020 TaxID=1380392 RepID=UPI0004907217|nr:2Fe-2S iron-sulfur cluster-binding protein [Nocardioides sp. URHA0020]